MTPLEYAMIRKPYDPELTRLILEHGAKVNVRSARGLTPLHLAAMKGDDSMIRLLCKSGMNINTRDKSRKTALHTATLQKHSGTMKLLIDGGAELDAQDHDGKTALHFACAKGGLELVELLLDNGANPLVKDHTGTTVLRTSFEIRRTQRMSRDDTLKKDFEDLVLTIEELWRHSSHRDQEEFMRVIEEVQELQLENLRTWI
jgi:ankyrin repeat protein